MRRSAAAADFGFISTFGWLVPRCLVDGIDLIAFRCRRGRTHDVVDAADVVVGGEVVRVADEGLRIGSQLMANVTAEAVVRRQI